MKENIWENFYYQISELSLKAPKPTRYAYNILTEAMNLTRIIERVWRTGWDRSFLKEDVELLKERVIDMKEYVEELKRMIYSRPIRERQQYNCVPQEEIIFHVLSTLENIIQGVADIIEWYS